jgi:hypothetical protein
VPIHQIPVNIAIRTSASVKIGWRRQVVCHVGEVDIVMAGGASAVGVADALTKNQFFNAETQRARRFHF